MPAPPVKRNLGFTLIELMIAIAIVAILLSVAMPAYKRHVDRAAIASIYRTLSSIRTPVELALQGGGPKGDPIRLRFDREILGLPEEGSENDPLARCGTAIFSPIEDEYLLTCNRPSARPGGPAIAI